MGWIVLLVGPLLVLADLGLTYALVGPGCNGQRGALLHLPMAVSFTLCLLLTLAALRASWRAGAGEPANAPASTDPDAAQERRCFITWLALAIGALSCLVIAALWLPVAVLSPCTV
ncbi:hypothetical protein [Azohydromonas lata]|uniref:Transmembrane protein n=1 Tax=Azohydromonas lata TaxID=45677 RepID=A0ABU5II65_9BURK|nr:hypothetical protein [Azohydromonas lata]MDZ5458181.1 hypothetical protein [Azohydromonas lata]